MKTASNCGAYPVLRCLNGIHHNHLIPENWKIKNMELSFNNPVAHTQDTQNACIGHV